MQRFVGRGRILSSGTVISGSDTKFMSEITSGDIIIIQHPTTLVEEVRSVTLVVSDISCSIKYFYI